MRFMRKQSILLLGGAGVLAATALALSVQGYEQYKTKKTTERAAVVERQNKQLEAVKTAQNQAESVEMRYDLLLAECRKGINAYQTLSPQVRAKLPAPTCTPL